MRNFRCLVSLSLELMLMLLLPKPALSRSKNAEPVLVLHVLNTSGISEEVLEKASDYLHYIYGRMGVQVVWLGDRLFTGRENLEGIDAKSVQLTVVLVSSECAGSLYRAGVTGVAIGNGGKGARRAYVFSDRAQQQAKKARRKEGSLGTDSSEALILGHVIAHEVGHLMLPDDRHSEKGIMKAQMNVQSIRDAVRGLLLFTQDEEDSILSVLSERLHSVPEEHAVMTDVAHP